MVDDTRKDEMRRYQERRTKARRARNLVSRTIWIRKEDEEAFAAATARFADHARVIEAATGGPQMSPIDLAGLIARHDLPYDPDELVFLMRLRENLWRADDTGPVEAAARRILAKYRLPATFEDLLG